MKTKQVLKMKPQPEMRKTKTFPRNLMTLSSKGRSVFYIYLCPTQFRGNLVNRSHWTLEAELTRTDKEQLLLDAHFGYSI